MINFYNQVPAIYTSASRDFQYLSWLINIVLNSVKHNVDDMYDLPNAKADPRLGELLALTLGFKVRRNYDQKQLIALVSIIPHIMKYKGTQHAIQMAAEALIMASSTSGAFDYEVEDNCIFIELPKDLVDVTLFIDLLPYILPAGMTCRIVRSLKQKTRKETRLAVSGVLNSDVAKDVYIANNGEAGAGNAKGLSVLYITNNKNDQNKMPVFTNFDEAGKLTTGLLENSIIPVLDDTFGNETSVNEEDN